MPTTPIAPIEFSEIAVSLAVETISRLETWARELGIDLDDLVRELLVDALEVRGGRRSMLAFGLALAKAIDEGIADGRSKYAELHEGGHES